MIITCDKCSTKFNLDETRISPTGSKVRCSVCRHVFTAFAPESPERDVREKTEEKPDGMEETVAFEEKEPGEAIEGDSFLGLEGIDDLGRELGIEDDEDEDLPESLDSDLTEDAETEQKDDQKAPERPFPAYEIELDKELEEELSSLEEEEDLSVEQASPEPEVPDELGKKDSELDAGLAEPMEEPEEKDTDLEFEKDIHEEDPGLDLEDDLEFSIDEEESPDPDLAEELDFDEPPHMDTLEAVPDESGPTAEKPEDLEGTEPLSMDTEDSDTELDFAEESFEEEISDTDIGGDEEFSFDDQEEEDDDSLDLDLEEFDAQEDEKEPEFDLDLDDETLELGMEDLEADEDAEFDSSEKETAEFDFMSADDESFELEIDSDLDGKIEEEEFQAEEEEMSFGKERADITESSEEQPELAEPPELEIGEFDLTETDEMDIELDDDTGLEPSDEFEFELEDEEGEDLEDEIKFEEEIESEGPLEEEESEEFDLTLYDETLEDEFEEGREEGRQEKQAAEAELEEEPEAEADAREEIEDQTIEKPPVPGFMDRETAGKPGGTSKFLKFILALLVIAIMLVAGYSTCIIMGIQVPYISSVKIPFIESALQKYQSRPEPVNITLDNQSINGRFASNKAEGKLFIITGRAANKSSFPVSHLQVEGTLITKGDVTARSKQVYCGNTVPEDTLKTAGISSIDKILAQKNGMNGSNENIRPNGSIPFMIVFSNLPDNLENFSVKLTGHSRPDQEN